MPNTLRPDLEPLPTRMQNLAIDDRGYPVPWFVDWVDGKPEFRAMDPAKWKRAVEHRRCWVCGEALGRYLCFVAGPMCGINRTSAEPPSHYECAAWSVRNCPFMRNPDAIRRVDDLVPVSNENTPGFSLSRNPGVFMLWITHEYSIFDDGKGMPLISFGPPSRVEWYSQGRPATREEVIDSIEGGYPALLAIAQQQPGAVQELREARERFLKYLPPERSAA